MLRFFVIVTSFIVLVAAPAFGQLTGPQGKAKPLTTTEIKQRLRSLGYWISATDSAIDQSYRDAIRAFHRVNDLEPTDETFSEDEFRLLMHGRKPRSFYPSFILPGTDSLSTGHFEVDLRTEVLYYVDSVGEVRHIIPASIDGNKNNVKRERGLVDWREYVYIPRGILRINSTKHSYPARSSAGAYTISFYVQRFAGVEQEAPPYKPVEGKIKVPSYAIKDLFPKLQSDTPILLHR